MKRLLFFFIIMTACTICAAQNPAGNWKVTAHTFIYEGKTIDSHAGLLTQKPCAANIVYEINTDGNYRLHAAASGCDEKYINIQQRLYSKTKWRVEGNKITISAEKNFSVGQTYIFSIRGNKMTWVGTEGQGTITYQKL